MTSAGVGICEELLRRHTHVADAVVTEHGKDGKGRRQLAAHVVPDVARIRRRSSFEGSTEALVQEWRLLYDWFYSKMSDASIGTDFAGWNSSYDDEPLPSEVMEDWRSEIVQRVISRKPRRILEIGAGNGLLMDMLASQCAEYWATDLSESLVRLLREHVAAQPSLHHVKVREQPADDPTGLPGEYFDAVIINSVVQYFPDGNYLARVLDIASRLITSSGAIYVGDVRDLRQHRDFLTAVHLRRAASPQPTSVLRTIDQQIMLEKELLVAPDFYANWGRDSSKIGSIEIRIKSSRYATELSRYRYEATLFGPQVGGVSAADFPMLSWQHDLGEDVSVLRRLVATKRTDGLRITGVPNARLLEDSCELKKQGEQMVLALGGHLHRGSVPSPFDIMETAAASGLRAALTWSAGSVDGSLDVVILPAGTPTLAPVTDLYRADHTMSLSDCTNDPRYGQSLGALQQVLLGLANRQLPSSDRLNWVTFADSLPRRPDGSVVLEHLLPPSREPDISRPSHSPVEEIVRGMFRRILKPEGAIGLHDDFYELGGDAATADRLVGLIGKTFGIPFGASELRAGSTPAAVASRVRRMRRQ